MMAHTKHTTLSEDKPAGKPVSTQRTPMKTRMTEILHESAENPVPSDSI